MSKWKKELEDFLRHKGYKVVNESKLVPGVLAVRIDRMSLEPLTMQRFNWTDEIWIIGRGRYNEDTEQEVKELAEQIYTEYSNVMSVEVKFKEDFYFLIVKLSEY